jgi:uridine phosphorylase
MERFTAKQYMDYYTAQRNLRIEDIGIAPTLLVTWMGGPVPRLVERLAARPCDHWCTHPAAPAYTGTLAGLPVTVARLRIGAPASVSMLEQFVACGARTIIGLGMAGSLQPELPIGSLIVATDCLSSEGTSAHYVKDLSQARADDSLATALAGAARVTGRPLGMGTLWSTDAPYMEQIEDIERHGRNGVLGVDMETSALYAFAAHRGLRCANLLVVSDELWHEWNPAFGTTELAHALEVAGEVILEALSRVFHDSSTDHIGAAAK